MPEKAKEHAITIVLDATIVPSGVVPLMELHEHGGKAPSGSD
jgi:hypothetical protein